MKPKVDSGSNPLIHFRNLALGSNTNHYGEFALGTSVKPNLDNGSNPLVYFKNLHLVQLQSTMMNSQLIQG